MVQSLGEVTTWLPISGGLTVYAHRYGDASLGVAMGWNYALSKFSGHESIARSYMY